MFNATCEPAGGSATAALTSQNGDQTKQVTAPFTISPCRAGSPLPSRGTGAKGGKPRVDGASATGLTTGKPSLVFQVVAGRSAGKLSALTVTLPRGLRFVRHRLGGKLRMQGVSVAGAKLKSAVLQHGHLVITLRRAVDNVIVLLSPGAGRVQEPEVTGAAPQAQEPQADGSGQGLAGQADQGPGRDPEPAPAQERAPYA